MRDLLTQPYFLLAAVPLVTICLGVFLKIVSRNDQHAAFNKEDYAIGPEVSITTLIVFITESVRRADAASPERFIHSVRRNGRGGRQ